MLRRTLVLGAAFIVAAISSAATSNRPADAAAGAFVFREIGGGEIDLGAFRGAPVLVVNTASRCGFTRQYDALQALYDRFRDRGFVVLGVPSNSFRQELTSAAAVQAFCEVNFGIDFPMTDIVEVRGQGAHPFFAWAEGQGAAPRWNFHKILLDGEGAIAATFPGQVPPEAPQVIEAIERLLPGA